MCRKIVKETRDQDQGNNIGLHPDGIDNAESSRISEGGILQRNHRQCQGDLTCKIPSSKKGLCGKHYRRWWRASNKERNKEYEQNYYKNITKPIKQLSNQSKEKVCIKCGVAFTRTGPNQKYCGRTCQNNVQCRNKLDNSPKYKLAHNIRARLRKALKGQSREKGIFKILDCSADQLKEYIESKFQQGMTWDNYGEWHLDHIKPLSLFNLANPEELRIAGHHTNLQPLWAIDNIIKGDKYANK